MRKRQRVRIIEAVGLPRGGKSTQCERLKVECEANDLTVAIVSDRDRIRRMHTPLDQPAMFATIIPMLAVEAYNKAVTDGVDILLLDRGFNDAAFIWPELYFRLGKITWEECRAIRTLFEPYADLVEHTLFFAVTPDEAPSPSYFDLDKIAADDEAVTYEFMSKLEAVYADQWHDLRRPTRIDGTRPIDETTDRLVELLKF